MEAKAPLVGAQGRVELHAEAAVDVDLALVVLPGHPEDDLALGFADPLDNFALQVFGVLGDNRAEGFEHFGHCLMEFHFARIALENVLIDALKFLVNLMR